MNKRACSTVDVREHVHGIGERAVRLGGHSQAGENIRNQSGMVHGRAKVGNLHRAGAVCMDVQLERNFRGERPSMSPRNYQGFGDVVGRPAVGFKKGGIMGFRGRDPTNEVYATWPIFRQED